MPLYLWNDDFCYRTPKSLKPLRPCLNPCLRFKSSAPPKQIKSESAIHGENGKLKRRVSFADHNGLALTKVKVYSLFDNAIDIPLNITDLFSAALKLTEDRLVLDFTQPSSDYLLFRQRLETKLVCLENCMLKKRALAGTVKVKNLSFEKSLKVRLTFDTWKSYTDLECHYVKDTYTGSDRDTFSFEVSLPAALIPHEKVEFAICYEVNGQTYWDSNQGQNYRIIRSALKSEGQGSFSSTQQMHSFDLGIHFDHYGSPRCSHGICPEWPRYSGYEEIQPYY